MRAIQPNLFGIQDKVNIAIERLRNFEPKEGYYLAFSGGKDSQCIYHLAQEAGVKFDAHYHATTVDPPELVRFIKHNYPDVEIHKPAVNMWDLIVKERIPPTRLVRYCCDELKEHGGAGRVVVTGVRWAESFKRRRRRKLVEQCAHRGRYIVNPIIDCTKHEVWEFIHSRQLAYCRLYDEGFERIGCVGCPQAGAKRQLEQFERWPHFKRLYLQAFEKMRAKRVQDGLATTWQNANEVMAWWLRENNKHGIDVDEAQMWLL